MEGLEVSVVAYKYVIKVSDILRLDSFFFCKEFINDENAIMQKKNSTFKDLGASLRSFGAYSLNNQVEYKNSGIPFIRGVNMKNGLINFDDSLYITPEAHKLLWKSEVKPETLLLSMSGTIGDVAVALPSFSYPINSNQDIAKIDLNGNGDIYYIYAFLRSKFGQNYLKREARGSVQQHVFLSQMENFRIPILDNCFQKKIRTVVLRAFDAFNESKSFYKQAEELLLEELGLKDWQPSYENINNKSFKESFLATGRLDAEYYQPKYEAYSNKINSYEKGYKLIKEEFDHIIYSPKKIKEGYNYIEIGDVNTGDGTNSFNFMKTEELPANAKILVKKGDLLVSKVRPYRGAVTIIESDKKDILVSGAFTVLRSKEKSVFSNEVLKVILRLGIYKDWLLQFNIGTQYPVIKDEDVLNLPIPMLDQKIQLTVKERISKSQLLKQQSEHLLEVAKRAVEITIEENEEIGMDYIKSNI